jgi:hypothetical protein
VVVVVAGAHRDDDDDDDGVDGGGGGNCNNNLCKQCVANTIQCTISPSSLPPPPTDGCCSGTAGATFVTTGGFLRVPFFLLFLVDTG